MVLAHKLVNLLCSITLFDYFVRCKPARTKEACNLIESEFHKGVIVAVVDKGDYQYQQLAPLFNEYGYGL